MKPWGYVAVAAFLVLGSGAALAQQQQSFLGGKVRAGDSVTVAASETIPGDLYVFAGDVRIDGRVAGDVVAVAGQVRIDGNVAGDVFASAGTVEVAGQVDGDVRVGAGQVRVSAPVGEDLLVAAGQVTVHGDVGGDLVFAAGQVSVTGDVGGDVLGRTGAYSNTGHVTGLEEVHVNRPRRTERRPAARALGRFVSAFLVGLGLLAYRRRRWVDETLRSLSEDPGPSAGWGAAFVAGLVVVPVGSLVLGILLSIFFGWLGLGPLVAGTMLAVLALWAFTGFVALAVIALLAPVTVGTWLAALVLPDSTPIYLGMTVGLAVLVAVELIPLLGALVGLAVTVFGGGAWVRTAWHHRRPRRDAPATIP